MPFKDIAATDNAIHLLRNALRAKRVASAYLFHGPLGVELSALAGGFTKALLCPELQDDFCDDCIVCRRIDHGNFADVHTLRAEKNSIGVETIRNELVGPALVQPYESKHNVFVIDNAHQMTIAASNALLKTLEEPPSYATILLISHYRERLLPTIRSRCQHVAMGILPVERITAALLARHPVDEEAAQRAARASGGRLTFAETLLDQEDQRATQSALNLLQSACARDIAGTLHASEGRAYDTRDPVLALLSALERLLREAMIRSAGADNTVSCCADPDLTDAVRELLTQPDTAADMLERVWDAQRALRANGNPHIVLADLLTGIAQRAGAA